MNFVNVNVAWYSSTFIFYLTVIALCYFVTVAGRRTVLTLGSSSARRIPFWEFAVLLILLFVKGLGTTGRDLRGGYYLNFLTATSMAAFRDQSVEIGYRLLNVIVHAVSEQYWVLVLVCSLITILPAIHMMRKYTDRIDLPVATLLYVTCFFFNSLSPMRQGMAAALTLYGFDAMVESRPRRALFWIALASTFHISALIFVFPLILMTWKLTNRKFIAFSLVIVFVVLYFGRDSIASMLKAGNSRYALYNSFSTVDFGFQQLVYYLPLLVLFNSGRKQDSNRRFARISFICLSIGFFCGMLGYVLQVFGRFDISFTPFIIIIPYYCKLVKMRFHRYRRLLNFTIIFYCVARFVIFITDYYGSQDLMPYTNVFGWVI